MPLNVSSSHPILVVAGPTACGKSSLAMDAAAEFDGVVINADSMQVYRELRILTARPSVADEGRVPHRLFGVLAAAEACSAGRWLAMAKDEIAAVQAAGRLPIVTGGTGLYLKALVEGLAPIPAVPAAVLAETQALHARLGGAAFLAELAGIDADGAGRLDPGDSQRLIRTYAVAKATGTPLSEWQRQPLEENPIAGRFATIVLMPPRAEMYAAIDARFEGMITAGALDEVRALDRLGLDPALPAMKAVGVRELRGHLRGEGDLEAAVEAAKRASRNYAKRQCTWLRHQVTGAHVISTQYSESLQAKIFSFIRQFLLTGHT